ncbi:MAG: helix-turn-helix transcriptional regulator [Saprospiraceae bacterium]
MEIGDVISKWRNEKGIKQMELALSSNIPVTVLSKIENGKRQPNLNQLSRISDNLEIPLPILLLVSMDINKIPEDKRTIINNIKNTVNDLVMAII